MRHTLTLKALLIGNAAAACCLASAAGAADTFSIAVIPDSQRYSENADIAARGGRAKWSRREPW